MSKVPELTIKTSQSFREPVKVEGWDEMCRWAMDNNMVWNETVSRLRSIRLTDEDSFKILVSQLLRANVALTDDLIAVKSAPPVHVTLVNTKNPFNNE